ncbi:GNAT family N-acetyltransferase [Marixanthomonas spongiae]|uniref:GNAT family N-acetyltransferase n=1 Tax=Marixanthomonas spongiae TaxID=2174845 RepID=A0A2U0I5Z5_9FLAO|nr:GNAT family protein [Marixanthomonas spongiae]PVW16512.1 GNAT family N-acetyltransferase [Marixanthomonas spongiae]
MTTLKGENIYLRALEQADLDFLYLLENDEKGWEVSNTTTPYSKHLLQQYLDQAHRDIYDVKQLRLVICTNNNETAIGFIDLYDFDPKHSRAGVGIVIFSEANKGKGYASEALRLVIRYAVQHLNIHQLYANITEDNQQSIRLFEKAGFVKNGIKKDWIKVGNTYKNELFYQLIPHVH